MSLKTKKKTEKLKKKEILELKDYGLQIIPNS